ncbi:hypothetical protein ACFOZ7_02070 [Natribaculum luteum]|uniref:DUF63 domain-containing protein n=1 Tax=Natribaculum luteum TaxID=1586232 RepID=A0ABD5NUX9_9EURY|nr:hypothetical protein [Natribaculum luteum]
MSDGRFYRILRPDRYVLAIFAFFVLFPIFMDFITPDVVYGYAGGTVDAHGNAVSRYSGGNAPQYQWYYPVLYPFILVWYVAVVLFDLVDGLLPMAGFSYYLIRTAYFYLLAAALAFLLGQTVTVVSRAIRG